MPTTPPIVPLNSLSRHVAPLAELLRKAAAETIGSGHYVLGRGVAQFEREFADYCGVGYCATVANGTDALELCLRAVGIGADEGVVLAANAAMYGTTAVLAIGAAPVFADIDATSGNLTAATIEQALESHPSARAVLVTHLYGLLAPIEDVQRLCEQRGLVLIEDCAQAHGARLPDGRAAGSFGRAASFSFYPTKNLGALGDGGAVVSNDADVHQRVLQLRQYGWTRKYENSLAGGRNSRLDEIQARFLSVMLPHLDRWNAQRQLVANRYTNSIRHAEIETPPAFGADHVAHLYVIRSRRRDALAAHLRNRGIGVEIHYPTPDHRQPVHASRYAGVTLPHTESWCDTVLTLPCFPEIEETEVDAVIDACNTWEIDGSLRHG